MNEEREKEEEGYYEGRTKEERKYDTNDRKAKEMKENKRRRDRKGRRRK